ncbi:MAG: tRNA (N6-isopentenyl adenosine(37)-C2)-methylthiotransferase MiaB [Candidatus Margulisiibacteriota bacterium]
MRRYFIKTYGCQMNVADSAKLAAVLEAAGYLPAPNSELADLMLINTCVVRQNAEDRAAWFVTSMKGLKELNPNLRIGLCGCIVTEPGRDVKKQFPHVDFFIPPNSPETLKRFLEPSPPLSPSPIGRGGGLVDRQQGVRAVTTSFVSIMTGCDNYCSYCVVPYVRGRETSRPMDEVLAEIKGLLDQGATDITLLGQNVNSYKFGLAGLLREIHSFVISHSSLVIRFLTSHPRDLNDELIQTVAGLPYVVKDFVLPLQSGDDEILARMNRGYTFDYYLGRINKIRELIPTARISSDLIVGFPGETEEQFQSTLKALELCRFNDVHSFAYSERPLVAAAKLPGQLPEEVKQARLQRLIEANRDLLALA